MVEGRWVGEYRAAIAIGGQGRGATAVALEGEDGREGRAMHGSQQGRDCDRRPSDEGDCGRLGGGGRLGERRHE
jgi:hypothetical protein